MKFELRTAGIFYNDESAEKLKKLGFEFNREGRDNVKTKDSVDIDISTINELIAFSKEFGSIVFDGYEESIEIYDDYRE